LSIRVQHVCQIPVDKDSKSAPFREKKRESWESIEIEYVSGSRGVFNCEFLAGKISFEKKLNKLFQVFEQRQELECLSLIVSAIDSKFVIKINMQGYEKQSNS